MGSTAPAAPPRPGQAVRSRALRGVQVGRTAPPLPLLYVHPLSVVGAAPSAPAAPQHPHSTHLPLEQVLLIIQRRAPAPGGAAGCGGTGSAGASAGRRAGAGGCQRRSGRVSSGAGAPSDPGRPAAARAAVAAAPGRGGRQVQQARAPVVSHNHDGGVLEHRGGGGGGVDGHVAGMRGALLHQVHRDADHHLVLQPERQPAEWSRGGAGGAGGAGGRGAARLSEADGVAAAVGLGPCSTADRVADGFRPAPCHGLKLGAAQTETAARPQGRWRRCLWWRRRLRWRRPQVAAPPNIRSPDELAVGERLGQPLLGLLGRRAATAGVGELHGQRRQIQPQLLLRIVRHGASVQLEQAKKTERRKSGAGSQDTAVEQRPAGLVGQSRERQAGMGREPHWGVPCSAAWPRHAGPAPAAAERWRLPDPAAMHRQ